MNQQSIAKYIEEFPDYQFNRFKQWFDTAITTEGKVAIRHYQRTCCTMSREQYESITRNYSELNGSRAVRRRAFAIYHWMLDNNINPFPPSITA